MPLIIDGHNLIGKTPWIELGSDEDEHELIRTLQEFSRVRRKKIEVYFDCAPAGFAGPRSFGNVTAFFVRQGLTADDAILARLKKIGKSGPNWTVISSDHMVQNSARKFRAVVLSSEEFVRELQQTASEELLKPTEKPVSTDEVDYWLDVFRSKKDAA